MCKLYTTYDGCNALTRPLRRFYTKPNCIGNEVKILWCSMRFAANAEKHKDIRTKEHKNNSASRLTGMDLRPCALKNIRATP